MCQLWQLFSISVSANYYGMMSSSAVVGLGLNNDIYNGRSRCLNKNDASIDVKRHFQVFERAFG